MGERLRREAPARIERERAARAQLVEDRGGTGPGRQTGAQWAKFFAAPRSIDGPPMSIVSTASSSVTSILAVTSSNG